MYLNFYLKSLLLLLLTGIYICNALWSIERSSYENPLLSGRGFHRQDACEEFDDLPVDCREKGCQYDCHENTCHSTAKPDCSTGCGKYCYDPCGCRQAGCFYDTRYQKCRAAEVNGEIRRCSEAFFGETDYYRPGPFYVRAGIICHNVDLGDHKHTYIHDTVWAVNFNGKKLLSSRKINFKAWNDKSIRKRDPFKTIKTRKDAGVTGVHNNDKPLYENYIVGSDTPAKAGRCATFLVHLNRAGIQDICIHTAEMIYTKPGQRFFNVRFLNHLVIHELDIMQLAKERKKGIEVCFEFHIRDKEKGVYEITIHGLEPTLHNKYMHEHAPLQICYSRCSHVQDPGFLVGAIEVTHRSHHQKPSQTSETLEDQASEEAAFRSSQKKQTQARYFNRRYSPRWGRHG